MESHETPPDGTFDAIERRLRQERVSSSALELDGIKREIYVRAARRAQAGGPRRLMFMKSRMAITMMLVLGALLSTSGVGLAVSGSSSSGAAAEVQYQSESQTPPTQESTVPTIVPTKKQNKHVSASSESAVSPIAQPAQQVAATTVGSGNTLPFTGYNAIPILVGGLGLLALGLVMRRQTRGRDI